MDIRDLTIKAAKHENEAVVALARVAEHASKLANTIHSATEVGRRVTLTMVSQHLEEATVKLAKAQAIWDLIAEEKAQAKPLTANLEKRIDSILYDELSYESGITPKIMDAFKQERDGD